MKTIMNRIVSMFISLVVLTVMVIPAISFAETNEDFTECVIPIISNKSEITEWRGLRKDGKLYIVLEDACELTGSEIVNISGETFTTQRNTVKLYGGISDKACLCVTMADYRTFNWNGEYLTPLGISKNDCIIQDFALDVIEHDGVYFVEMMPYVYAFGADISNFSQENIEDIDADVVSELLAAYNIKFDTFDNYYIVDTYIPFDEVLTEYMNNPDYQFQWKNWIEKSNAGAARLWDVIVDYYDGIFNYVFDSYESDMLYNEALIAILQCKPGNFKEEDTLLETLENLFSIDSAINVEREKIEIYNQFCSFAEFISSDDNLGKDISELLEIYTDDKVSSIVSLADTILEYASYYNQIVKFDDLESNILYYGVLYDKNEEEYENKNISNLIDEKTEFLDIIKRFSGAKGGLAKFQKLYESYSGLYDSAEKLDSQIKDKRRSAFEGMDDEIRRNVQSAVLDFVIEKAVPKAVPYLSAVDFTWNLLKVVPGAEVSDASKAEYIQRTALDRVSLDNSEKSYYSLILAMQSSYYAYSRMLTYEKRMAESENPDTNDEVLKHRIELDKAKNEQNIKKYRERCSKLSELITKAYCSNRLFYGNMNSDWEWTLAKELTGSLSEDIPDYSVEVGNAALSGVTAGMEPFKPRIYMMYERAAYIDGNGNLYMWGLNQDGEVGNGTRKKVEKPKLVLSNVVEVYDVFQATAALTSDGTLYTWGSNWKGRAGLGDVVYADTPQELLKDVVAFETDGGTSAAITKNGALYMWGDNYSGTVGTGPEKYVNTPTKVLDNVRYVSFSSFWTTAAITNDNKLYMWGYNSNDQVKSSLEDHITKPVFIMDNVASFYHGGHNSAAITLDKDLYMWGENSYEQIGVEKCDSVDEPYNVMSDVINVYLREDETYAISSGNTLYKWGKCFVRREGDLTYWNSSPTPQIVMENIKSVYGSFIIDANDVLYAYGGGLKGPYFSEPVELYKDVKEIFTNKILTNNGSLYDLDYNEYKVTDLVFENVSCFSRSKYNDGTNAVITNDGFLYIWGKNDNDYLGIGSADEINQPILFELPE